MRPEALSRYELEYVARGRRSVIYKFKKGKKVYGVKVEKNDSGAKERIKNEVKFLKILNKEGVGPKLISSGKEYFVYEFVEGEKILDFLEHAKDPMPVMKDILKQCRKMDRLGINKLEMHHPMKHIFIRGKKVVMIDFERCYYSEKPKNVTQFVQFLLRAKRLSLKKERVVPFLREYKKHPSEKSFRALISVFS